MKTDKETLDALFENGELTPKCKRSFMAILAGKYILEILKESNKKHGIPFMCYEEIIYQLRKKEPGFTFENIDGGLYTLNCSGQARYITNGSAISGMVLPKEQK